VKAILLTKVTSHDITHLRPEANPSTKASLTSDGTEYNYKTIYKKVDLGTAIHVMSVYI